MVEETEVPPFAVMPNRRCLPSPGSAARSFPEHFEIEQMLSSGDYVTMRWTAVGTHDGELMGIPPTNKRVVTHGCTVEEVKNGKAVREWVYWDTGNLLRQIGILPSHASTVAAAR